MLIHSLFHLDLHPSVPLERIQEILCWRAFVVWQQRQPHWQHNGLAFPGSSKVQSFVTCRSPAPAARTTAAATAALIATGSAPTPISSKDTLDRRQRTLTKKLNQPLYPGCADALCFQERLDGQP